jgi:hypothetical protein
MGKSSLRYLRGFFYLLMVFSSSIEGRGSKKAPSFKYELAIATIFQNEATYLSEWIDYHHMLGVDHFYLYNHNSSDHFQEVLAPYIEKGLVELFDYSSNRHQQMTMMANAVKISKNVAKWLAFIDSDEFIYPKKMRTITQFLKDYEPYPAVALNWECFGTSYVDKIPDGELMIDHLILKAEEDNMWNSYVKCIVRPERVKRCKTAHSYDFNGRGAAVRPDKSTFGNTYKDSPQNDLIVINHYWTRDQEYFENIKIPRCKNTKGWSLSRTLREAEAMNKVEDKGIIHDFSKELKEFREQLQGLSKVF